MKKTVLFFLSGILMTIALVSNLQSADKKKVAGSWVHDGHHSHTNMVCYQPWTCAPSEAHLTSQDYRISCTPNKITTGACAASDTSPDACAVCVAGAPKESCECWVEKK